MEDQNYLKLYKGSPLYNNIVNYMKNRKRASIEYLNNECRGMLQDNLELYKTKLKEFYKNYPPLFNKEVCHEEI